MSRNDFIVDLLAQEAAVSSPGRTLSVEDRVKHFFDGSLNYGALLSHTKLQASDLDDKQIAFAAERLLRMPASTARQEILSQKVNVVFSYRAEWREDLWQLVYIPTARQFITFMRGY